MPTVINNGRSIWFISGINVGGQGGQGSVNMPTNIRAHRGSLLCTGIAYQAPVVSLSAADTGTGTVTATVLNGVITALTLVTTNSSLGAGTYALRFTDVAGVGATGTYTVNGGNVITGVVLTSGGISGPVPAQYFFTTFRQMVGGVNMRDILPLYMNMIAKTNGYTPRGGELPFFFTEPWRNYVDPHAVNSWDLFGQSSWQIFWGVTTQITNPQLTGWIEFDEKRNQRPALPQDVQAGALNIMTAAPAKVGEMIPFLNPISQHSITQQVPAGRYDVPFGMLPISYPILRYFMLQGGAGNVYQSEVYQDGNKILEATNEQMLEAYAQYGFNVLVWDSMYLSDPDQRIWKALKVLKQLILRIYSTNAGNLTVVQECLPGAYAA